MTYTIAARMLVCAGLSLPGPYALLQAETAKPRPGAPADENTQTEAEAEAEIEQDIANAEESHIATELGLGLHKGLGPEVQVRWHLDEDLILGLRFGRYSAENLSHFDELQLTSIGALSRFQVEGSFFVEAALDVSQLKVKINEANKSSSSGSGTYGFNGSLSQSYLTLGFGNQLKFDRWTVGLQWLRFYIPFNGSSIKSSSSGEIADRESRERQNYRDLKTEAWDINYGLALHAGTTF